MRRLRLIKQLHRWHNMNWLDAILAVMTLDNRKLELLEELVRIAAIKWLSSFGTKATYTPWRYSNIKEQEAINANKRSIEMNNYKFTTKDVPKYIITYKDDNFVEHIVLETFDYTEALTKYLELHKGNV